jgi:hypothetical protein
MAACMRARPAGKFAMHIDFNQHFVTKLDARLVFITYLTPRPSPRDIDRVWTTMQAFAGFKKED